MAQLKTSSNFVAYLNNSISLIADYDGALLLNESFKFYFIFMNCILFIASSLCLMTLLFVSSQNKIRMKLIKYYTLIESLSALLTILLMAKLWFSPFKLELDEREWQNDIKKYTYNLEPQLSNYNGNFQQHQNQLLFQSSSPNIILSSSSLQTTPENDQKFEPNANIKSYNYVDLVDKLQYALGCCGILSPDDWHQENQLLGLLAPSCCLQPTHIEISIPKHSNISKDNHTMLLKNDSTMVKETATATAQREVRNFISISYCKIELSNTIGCQNLLSNRQIQFTFNLRMSLLFLLSILIILIMAALNFYAPSHLASSSKRTSTNRASTVLATQASQFYLTTNRRTPLSTNTAEPPSTRLNSLTKAQSFKQVPASVASNTTLNEVRNHPIGRDGQNYRMSDHIGHIEGSDSTTLPNSNPQIQNPNLTIPNLNCDTVVTIS